MSHENVLAMMLHYYYQILKLYASWSI